MHYVIFAIFGAFLFDVSMVQCSTHLAKLIENRPLIPENPYSPQFSLRKHQGHVNDVTFSRWRHLTGLEIDACAILSFNVSNLNPLEMLTLRNNVEFPEISADFFRYLENLRVFRYENNFGEIQGGGAFEYATNLTVLDVKNINLPILTQNFLGNLEKLRELALINDEIEIIEKDAFDKLPNMRQVFLSGNKLKIIQRNVFKNQRNLENLQLNSNQLENFNENFAKIPSLKILNVANNNLSEIDTRKLFRNFPNLKYFNFQPNHLTCSHELYVTDTLRRYNVTIEHFEVSSACQNFNLDKLGRVVFSEP